MTKVYVYDRYDGRFIREFDCDFDDCKFKNGQCVNEDDCNDTVNDSWVTDGFGHRYFSCYSSKQIRTKTIICAEGKENEEP